MPTGFSYDLPPGFDRAGNLTVGDLFGAGAKYPMVPVTLAKMHDRFVGQFPRSVERPVIWKGWMNHRTALSALNVPYVTMVGGSYLTAKTEPKDIDICIVFDSVAFGQAVAQPGVSQAFRQLTDTSHTRPTFRCDAYPLPVYPMTSGRFFTSLIYMNYWTRVFGIDRKGNQRSVLLVTESGVL